MAAPLWVPSDARRAAARVTAFRQVAQQRHGLSLPDEDALWRWSVDQPADFWALVWDELGVVAHAQPEAILDNPVMPGATWFRGARLNYAENLLRHTGDGPALVGIDESEGAPDVVSWDELRRRVARFQTFLEGCGVGPGDRVAAWMPNRTETVVAMLATAAIGAIFSSSSPDFGIKGVLDRFGQIGPKVLLVADGARYGGKTHRLLDRAREVCEHLKDSLVAVVVVPVIDTAPDLAGLPGAASWPDALAEGPDEPRFASLPFDHPLYIMYSSGTTGVPKCILHGAGGTLVQHAKEHALHTDLGPDDVLFYFTTAGWMMWNWLVGGLFVGSTVVLYDGSPAFPDTGVLWRAAATHGITVFGTSPKFLSQCAKDGLEPGRAHDLSRLKAVLSTGAPLSIENFRWVYDHVSGDVQLASICGGTDILSCFMLGCPTVPVYEGEIQRRGLGMAVQAWAGPNQPVVGQKAELVCTQPFPSMPLGFWGDDDGSRYHQAYFDHFPGVWRHGDYIELTARRGVIVYGRSDATLNPGGVRIGTAEIYRPVEAMDEVREAIVVGLPDGDDTAIVLFVVLADGTGLDEDLLGRMRRAIRSTASPRHVPARILVAPAIPRTLSGKKVEIAVTRVLTGQDAPNRDALANPEALDWFANEGREAVQRPE